MKNQPLRLAKVLVLEDDYYLATDLTLALQAAGAHVIGPFADTASALEALDVERPDCALVDLNLGQGIDFALPHELGRRSISFAFVTGYDQTSIPEAFAGTIRIEKPIAPEKITDIAERLLPRRRT